MRRVCQVQLYVPTYGITAKNYRNEETYGYGFSPNFVNFLGYNLVGPDSFVDQHMSVALLYKKRAGIFQ